MPWINDMWFEEGAVYVRDWCPECTPDGVPEPWSLRRCPDHGGDHPKGDLDSTFTESFWLSGAAEAGGADNSAFCKLIHDSIP